MYGLLKEVARVLREDGTGPTEAWTSFVLLVWGLWLVLPPDTLTGAKTPYSLLVGLTPEWTWGSLAILISLLALASLGSKQRALRRWSALAEAGFWFSVAVLIVASSYIAVAWVTYLALAIVPTWAYFRLR